MSNRLHRRRFLQASAAGTLGYFFTAPAFSADRTPGANGKLRFAGVGVGGKGSSDIDNCAELGDIIAICDCDEKTLAGKAEQQGLYDRKKPKFPDQQFYAKAKRFTDYRKLFEDKEIMKAVDALTISTPDHNHALPAVLAMRAGKHVYVQKPLTRTVFEADLLKRVARQYKVCTQMGNQGTAANGLRRAVEFVRAGGIGPVKEVHVWTNRPIWPQAPKVTKRPEPAKEVPSHINWDAFLGPAPERPYAKGYHPFAWRGWWDFGTGAIGDMACHTANMAYMALKLGLPTHVAAEAGDVNPETCPSFAHVTLKFPARGDLPAVTLHWYEGMKDKKNVLPAPELVPGQKKREKGYAIYFDDKDARWKFVNPNEKDPKKQTQTVSSGSFLVGEKAVLFSPDDYGADSYVVTPDAVERLTGEPKELPKNGGGDFGQKKEWVEAIKAGKPEAALSNFDYASQLTAAFLLGNVAIRSGKAFGFDPEKLQADSPEAAKYLHYEYRKGWDLLGEKA